jgi:urease accessory protein
MSEFLGGLLHPLVAPAHIVALIALGLLIGQRRKGLRLLPALAFAAALVGGLVALSYGVAQTAAGNVLLGTAVVTGLCAAFVAPIPMFLVAALAIIVGGAIGLDSPPQALSLDAANRALIGTFLGASVLLWLCVKAATLAAQPWHRIALRVVASWCVASAILVLALRLVK